MVTTIPNGGTPIHSSEFVFAIGKLEPSGEYLTELLWPNGVTMRMFRVGPSSIDAYIRDCARQDSFTLSRKVCEFDRVLYFATEARMPAESPRARGKCPDCSGTGQYCGLQAVEACRACGGTGSI